MSGIGAALVDGSGEVWQQRGAGVVVAVCVLDEEPGRVRRARAIAPRIRPSES
jgi:hypothetical protein